jgi:hypothetical protein
MRDGLMDEVFGNECPQALSTDPMGAVQPDSFPGDQCRQGTLSGEAGKVQILESAASNTISDSRYGSLSCGASNRSSEPGPRPRRRTARSSTWLSAIAGAAVLLLAYHLDRRAVQPGYTDCSRTRHARPAMAARRGLAAVQNRDCRRGVCHSGESSVASVAGLSLPPCLHARGVAAPAALDLGGTMTEPGEPGGAR